MEPSKEAISVRIARLKKLFSGQASNAIVNKHYFGREGFIDALIVLYDECNNDVMKKDKNICLFVDKFRSTVLELRRLRVNINDFEIKKLIGRGQFGEVQVVREKHTGDIYAMKIIKKINTLTQQSVAFYEEERDIMAHAASPWLTSLQYAFQDMSNLYLAMEFHPGGDLLGLLERSGNGFPEEMSRFYLAELVLAIKSLHSMGYVHRDIKPDNILLDRCGHLKLADFGSAAKLTAAGVVVSQMPVGTPEYVAPEILRAMENMGDNTKKSFYGIECDYWSLGIVAYEMIAGVTPFCGSDPMNTFSGIMNHKSGPLEFPRGCDASEHLRDMVTHLLQDSSSRLGHLQLLQHRFFKEVDWNSIRNIVPPFVPTVNGMDDTSNFAEIKRVPLVPSIENYKTKKQFSGSDLPFIGFTFVQEHGDDFIKEITVSSKHCDGDMIQKNKEIKDLWRKIHILEQGSNGRNKDFECLEQKVEEKSLLLEDLRTKYHKLEVDYERCKKDKLAVVRTLELSKEEQKTQETKALSMIRDMKASWKKKMKEEVDELNDEIRNQAERNAELLSVNVKMSLKLQKQDEDLSAAKEEMAKYQSLVQMHNDKLSKARNLSRQSVTGAEFQVKQLSESHQKQIADLKDSLVEEQQKCIILEEELRKQDEEIKNRTDTWNRTLAELENLTEQNRTLSRQHEEKDAKIQQLEAKVVEIQTSQTDNAARQQARISERARIAELEKQLRKEQAEGDEMKNRLCSLEDVLSESMMSHESMLANREAERDEQMTSLMSKLKAATEDKHHLQERLQEATQNEADVSLKVNSLEQMLQQFQRGLAKLEEENSKLKVQNSLEHNHRPTETLKVSDAQKEMLEAQIEKLESQLEKLRETSVLERKEKSELESKFWKINKDLENSKLDMRIAQREAKTAEQQIKVLQDEKKKFQEKATAEQASLGEQLQAERVKIAALEAHLKELTGDLETANKEIASKTKAVEEWKSNVSKLTNEIKSTKSSTDAQSNELNLSKNKCDLLQGKNETLNKEITTLKIKLAEALERERSLNSAMKQETIKFTNLEQNVNLLKDTCAMLEDQLVDYEQVANNYESKMKTFQTEKDALQAELDSLSDNLRSARQSANEEKSLRLRAEVRAKQLESELVTRTDDLAVSESRCDGLDRHVAQLTREVGDLEEQMCSSDAELRGARRLCEATRAEQNALKEEISQLLTQIHSLKESNFQLTTKLENSEDYNQEVVEKLSNTKNQLEELQAFYKHREFKTNATVEQQTKLIDFLQRKVEEAGKKKKTLTEKIFGSNQKENVPLVAPFSYKEIHAMLSQERSKNQGLNEKLMRAQAQLVTLKGEQILDAINEVPFESPQTRLAMSKLVQSPGTQSSNFKRQHSMQRMHHNIPHRFEPKLSMRATKCACCLDSIHFGRNATVCQECRITAHPKCSLLLPTTCGLPDGFARHFSQSWKESQGSDLDGRSTSGDDATPVRMEGYVKLPQRGKSCWERKYLVLEGDTLLVYEHEPSKNMEPVEKMPVCTKDGTTSILSAVPYSDVVDTAKTDLPYILKVVITPRTTCWPGNSLLIMALSFPDKQAWVSALESVIHRSNQFPSLGASQTPRYQGSTLLSLPRAQAMDVNCVLQLSPSLLLLGAQEGLYSLRISDKGASATPVHIAGVTEVHQVAFVHHLGVAIMIAGESRALVQCESRQLVASAEAAECSNPTVDTKPVLVTTAGSDACCHLFAVNADHNGHHARTVLCAATADKLVLLTWSINQNGFNVVKVLDTSEPCSCIHFSPHSILVGCNKFFEIDLRDFSAEEFLDSADKSLHNAVEGAQQLNSFPVAILDVSKSQTDLEYLLCFNEFGVFVDKYGQRTRANDIKWSHLPMAFSYRKPYLFIFHFTSVEVMRLSTGSFAVSRDDSTDSSANYPRQTFVELNTPRYLGPAVGEGSVYLSHVAADQTALQLVRMEGRLACKEDIDYSCSSLDTLEPKQDSDGADLNGGTNSEFSFTSSLVNSLDGDAETDDSPRSTSDERRVRFDSRTLHTDL